MNLIKGSDAVATAESSDVRVFGGESFLSSKETYYLINWLVQYSSRCASAMCGYERKVRSVDQVLSARIRQKKMVM